MKCSPLFKIFAVMQFICALSIPSLLADETIVHKKYVPENILAIFDQIPTILEPWDSMLTY